MRQISIVFEVEDDGYLDTIAKVKEYLENELSIEETGIHTKRIGNRK